MPVWGPPHPSPARRSRHNGFPCFSSTRSRRDQALASLPTCRSADQAIIPCPPAWVANSDRYVPYGTPPHRPHVAPHALVRSSADARPRSPAKPAIAMVSWTPRVPGHLPPSPRHTSIQSALVPWSRGSSCVCHTAFHTPPANLALRARREPAYHPPARRTRAAPNACPPWRPLNGHGATYRGIRRTGNRASNTSADAGPFPRRAKSAAAWARAWARDRSPACCGTNRLAVVANRHQ